MLVELVVDPVAVELLRADVEGRAQGKNDVGHGGDVSDHVAHLWESIDS